MIRKVEHIGIAVQDLEKSNALFRRLFGKDNYKIESVPGEKVDTSFFMLGETKIELVQATSGAVSITRSRNS
jgi:methylmalonyl-CoA/ethylmalonyl-CoA epimerase